MATVLQAKLMQSPLVTWLRTFKENGSHLTYRELCGGSFLREAMMQIRPKAAEDNVVTLGVEIDDAVHRLLCWSLLIRSIRSFYVEELQQMVVMKMPDIVTLAKDPDNESCPEDIRRTLLLLLGCAVQCERKEFFISQIVELDVDAQHGIMEHIQEITDGLSNVLTLDTPIDELDATSRTLYYHLNKVITERDRYIDNIAKISIENDVHQLSFDEQQKSDAGSVTAASPLPSAADKHHIAVELADSKAKLRRLRMDLHKEREEKGEVMQELRDELVEQKQMVAKLRQENLSLTQDARSARSYRDELDIYKEKARRADKLEADISRYKDRINELDFYKARVDELREDNKILLETKIMLEEQLTTSQKRVETIIELENELMKCKHNAEEMSQERDQDRYRIRELAEAVARLEHDKKSTLSESASLEEELLHARSHMSSDLNASLSDQLLDTTKAEMLQMQLENQRLQRVVTDMKEQTALENSSRLLELEKENQRLAKKVAKLLESNSRETEQSVLAEQRSEELERRLTELQQTLETVSESHERQRNELEQENEQLSSTVEALRERSEKTHDLRIKEAEKENKRLAESVGEMSTRVSRLEYDNRQLQKALERANENSDRIKQMEDDNERLAKESVELHKNVTTLKVACDNYEHLEQEISDLEVENRKLQKAAEGAKAVAARLERSELDNIAIVGENQRLARAVEALRSSSATRLAEMEVDRDTRSRELAELRRTNERIEQESSACLTAAEARLGTLEGDNERLRRSAEALAKHAEARETDYGVIEAENRRLEASAEALKMSLRRLDGLENDGKRLEEECADVSRENTVLEKENRKLKQALEGKEAAVDDYEARLAALDRELKTMKKIVDKAKDSLSKAKDLEAENKDLLQQSAMDKKTIATLREDLVNEKIRTQQLINELDKLNTELEKVGLDKEKLAALELAQEDSRFHALENMMQDALKNNMEIRDDKIRTLEKHLEDSRQINATLQKQLDILTREYEAYLLRRAEEPKVSTIEIPSPRAPQMSVSQLVIKERKPNVAKEISEMRDHIIATERRNAVLTSENDGLKAQYSYTQERLQKAEAQLSSLSTQVASVQGEKNLLQSKNAQLQVENTTLLSQMTSHVNQNVALQQQLARLEAELEKLVLEHQESADNYETLVNDHESLQQLNDQLSSEYEMLISEHGALKALHKNVRSELQEALKDRENVAKEKAAIEELQQSLAKERDALSADGRRGDAAFAERDHWREESSSLRQQNDRISGEYRRLQQDYRAVKTECNQMKLKHTELQGDMADCKDQINRMDVEVSKLVNRCEALEHLNCKLEDENRQLIFQLQALLQQNQDLLQQTLDSSEHFHEEERSYVEQLNNLQKHKEKLENKIMDQYRNIDSGKQKKKGFGGDLLRKAKGFIARKKDKKDLSKSQQDLLHQTSSLQLHSSSPPQLPLRLAAGGRGSEQQDTMSLVSAGSSSYGEANESGSELTVTRSNKVKLRKTRMRAQSIENLFAAPSNTKTSFLSVHHRQMAVSTTSLNISGARGKLREVSLTIPLETAEEGRRTSAQQQPTDMLSAVNDIADHYSERPVMPRLVGASSAHVSSPDAARHHGRHSSASSEDSNVPTRDTDGGGQESWRDSGSDHGVVGAARSADSGKPTSVERRTAEPTGSSKLFYTPMPVKKSFAPSAAASASPAGVGVSSNQLSTSMLFKTSSRDSGEEGITPIKYQLQQPGAASWHEGLSRQTSSRAPSSSSGSFLASAASGDERSYARRDEAQRSLLKTSTPKAPPAGSGSMGERWLSAQSIAARGGSSPRPVTPTHDIYGSKQQLTSVVPRNYNGIVYPDPSTSSYGSLHRQKPRAPDIPSCHSFAPLPSAAAVASSPHCTTGAEQQRLSSLPTSSSYNSSGVVAEGETVVARLGRSNSADAGAQQLADGDSSPQQQQQPPANADERNTLWLEYGCV